MNGFCAYYQRNTHCVFVVVLFGLCIYVCVCIFAIPVSFCVNFYTFRLYFIYVYSDFIAVHAYSAAVFISCSFFIGFCKHHYEECRPNARLAITIMLSRWILMRIEIKGNGSKFTFFSSKSKTPQHMKTGDIDDSISILKQKRMQIYILKNWNEIISEKYDKYQSIALIWRNFIHLNKNFVRWPLKYAIHVFRG